MVSLAGLVWRGGVMATVNYPTYPDLANKVAVVTGGSRGIGAATCRLLAQNGAKVTVGGRDEAAIDSVVQEIQDRGAVALRDRLRSDRHFPDGEELSAWHDRAWARLDRHHGFQRCPPPLPGLGGLRCGQGGGGDVLKARGQRGRPARR